MTVLFRRRNVFMMGVLILSFVTHPNVLKLGGLDKYARRASTTDGSSLAVAGNHRQTLMSLQDHEHAILEKFVQKAQHRARVNVWDKTETPDFQAVLADANVPPPQPSWQHEPYATLADISIVGLPKAGTSQLYQILRTHPDARQFHPDKEKCPGRKNNLQTALPNYHREMWEWAHQAHLLNDTRLTINACLQEQGAGLNMAYIRPNMTMTSSSTKTSRKKAICIFRDPAELVYASFNFWSDLNWDSRRYVADWTHPTKHYRSPELLHEIVLAGNRSKPYQFFVKQRQQRFLHNPKTLLQYFGGPENVLFLRNEDMLPGVVDQPGGLLDKLAGFTGLDRAKFLPSVHGGITNCNANKGAGAKCQQKETTYRISGNRPMLPLTKWLLYLETWEECKILSRHFGIHYPECLEVMDRAKALLAIKPA